jgi:hypothetical protein
VCGDLAGLDAAALGIGWYMTWQVRVADDENAGPEHWQMVRVSQEGFWPGPETLREVASARPGAVWLVGNEPDVVWQDNTTAEQYARHYHRIYGILKDADPTSVVAAGGVSQPTPLRLEYLDRVLAAYRDAYGEPLPSDMWHVHNFVLREERDSWGVGIPPGFGVDAGVLREIDEHDSLAIFREQVVAFREWMASRGQRDRPLAVTEYGILMPSDYGFGYERVSRFMVDTFDYFLAARSFDTGYQDDDNRLVQFWCWYSTVSPTYPTGDLFSADTGRLTPLGVAYARYVPPEDRAGEE